MSYNVILLPAAEDDYQEILWKFTESSTERKIIRNIYKEERRCADCIAALLFTGGVFYRNQNTESAG